LRPFHLARSLLVVVLCSVTCAQFSEINSVAAAHSAEYRVIPAAPVGELTPSKGHPRRNDARWLRSHGDDTSSRYSPLKQIDRTNVSRLAVAWTYRSGDGNGNIQANPVVADGVMYVPTVGHHVAAINAETGVEVWRFKTEGRPAHRGLAFWPGNAQLAPRLFVPAGKHLYAINAKTGTPISGFGVNGRVAAESVVAPAIFEDVVILPCWNVVKGFRVSDGELLWQFHIIPQDGEYGRDTWSKRGGGANSWGGIALDAERGIAYFSTGSPHPNFIGVNHTGDNLFANCVLALDARTGKRIWHFQEIRHDIWDLDIPAPPNLVTVTREGRKFDAVAQVTKIGNTLLLDRLTGKPLFPFRLRRAPASKLPGESAAEWQPAPELPEPFSTAEFTLEDVTTRTAEARAAVMKQLENATLGWFTPFELNRPNAFFGIHGGAEWMGAAFDPVAERLYVNSNHIPWIITVSKRQTRRDIATPGRDAYRAYCAACHGVNRAGLGMAPPLANLAPGFSDEALLKVILEGRKAMPPIQVPDARRKPLLDFLMNRDQPKVAAAPGEFEYTSNGYPKLLDHEGYPGSKPPWGTLNAIDLNSGKIVWRVPLGEYEELTRSGMPLTGTENFGGATVTAGGLVFCAGTLDHKIRAFDAATGRELWAYRLPFGGYAPPAVYEVNGRQYVVIAATSGGKLGGAMGDAYVAFALP
jgi:quinoprotein glucose dehydrogenase